MFIHDIIKIRLVSIGYLPNYPYHMISDNEMYDAFINSTTDTGYFFDYYPCLDNTLQTAYDDLVTAIRYHIAMAKVDNSYVIPNWVYSYMLGNVTSIHSDDLDIGDLIESLGVNNIENTFNSEVSEKCYTVSVDWLKRLGSSTQAEFNGNTINTRPPTMFGEPHIYKSIRISG